jgi:hypothetical protein
MKDSMYKKYTKKIQLSIKGEAFFESLVSNYCIPHKIAGPKDLGMDYICEWTFGDKPTGVIFGVQIKTYSQNSVSITFQGKETKLNGLEKFKITNIRIDKKTEIYLKGLEIPIYLFALIPDNEEYKSFTSYYKRLTLSLFGKYSQSDLPFYKANEGLRFFSYREPLKDRQGGFTRDLYIDYMRLTYYKGSITYLEPLKIGLRQFPEKEAIFEDLFNEYKDRIIPLHERLKRFLKLIEESKSS